MNSVICIIPARRGSRELKNKNIKLLNNIPLIMYPYQIAKRSKLISKICISSDSKKYLNLFKNKKVLKILRPSRLAQSNSKVVDTILHALSKIKDEFKFLVLLEPTSPLTSSIELDKALRFFFKLNNKADSMISIFSNPKYYDSFKCNVNKNFKYMKKFNFNKNMNRQNFKKKEFFFSGNFYISKISSLKKNKSFLTKKTYCYPIKKSINTDIDNINDFLYADVLLKKRIFKLD
tara:strand:+ start:314 stop:1015 length:702 start_codon:yes stop_codon:yes gene_type:complete